jgi:uncharacterized protein YqeY
MSLQQKLNAEIKSAMLAKNAERLGTLRMLKSALGYLLIERNTEELDDPGFVTLVQKEAKKRRDSIEQFEKGGRPELAEVEKSELTILSEFLPQPLSADELETLVKKTIAETGATSKKDMGGVIKAVQAQAGGRADGKSISQVVGRLLA